MILIEEIRRALMQAGQQLSRHIRKENKEADLERKLAHIEQFGPILVEGLVRITGANEARKKKAEEGLKKLLGRDTKDAIKDLSVAEVRLAALKEKAKKAGVNFQDRFPENEDLAEFEAPTDEDETESSERGTGKQSTEKAGQGTEKSAQGTEKSAQGTEKATQGTAKSADFFATTAKIAKVAVSKSLVKKSAPKATRKKS